MNASFHEEKFSGDYQRVLYEEFKKQSELEIKYEVLQKKLFHFKH